jgi:hypothetical protein
MAFSPIGNGVRFSTGERLREEMIELVPVLFDAAVEVFRGVIETKPSS